MEILVFALIATLVLGFALSALFVTGYTLSQVLPAPRRTTAPADARPTTS